MTNINTFLNDNPTEVIVFIYQVNSAVDQPVDLNAFNSQLASIDGFLDKLYIHTGVDQPWPTLGELTSTNKVSAFGRWENCMVCTLNGMIITYPSLLSLSA